jgi:hypothetical protein
VFGLMVRLRVVGEPAIGFADADKRGVIDAGP